MPEQKPAGPDLFADVNRVKDPANMTDLEKKHVPVISAPDKVAPGECFEVKIEVGKLMAHPNANDHFIGFIELYAGHVFIARIDLVPHLTCPIVKVAMRLDKAVGSLRVFGWCNIHGTWEADKPIQVA
jgi:superoxide reductase